MEHEHDHRVLGRRLELFDTTASIGAGLPIWLPAGAVVRSELERFAAEQAAASGCRRVYTPVMAKRALFERSGHWDKFREDMFPPMRVGGEELVLRPANCPSHVQVYAARQRSWRELPVRLAEAGSMFRSEQSGVLGGLSRVRQINLDDAHVFCRPEQVVEEVALALRAIRSCYDVLGIDIAYFRLSLRGPHGEYAGDDDGWAAAERQLTEALEAVGETYLSAPDEAAFYGPKIDVQVLDAAGREETLSTVQVDHVLPERFGLIYIAADGSGRRPVMVHRGLLSSMERMVALLIEQDAGRFPTWLSPVQVEVLPVHPQRHGPAAEGAVRRLEAAGLRVELSDRDSLGARIRAAHRRRSSWIAVIGDAEVEHDALAIDRVRVGTDEFIAIVRGEVDGRLREHPPLPRR